MTVGHGIGTWSVRGCRWPRRSRVNVGIWKSRNALLTFACTRASAERIGRLDRELNSKDRAPFVHILRVHATAVSFHDRSRDGETHPEPLGLRGVEWLEGTQLRLRR